MSNADVPIWEKYTLTIDEAAKYFRIGENKLRKLAEENPAAGWVIMNGNRIQIKRKQFEKGIVQLAQEGAIQVFRQKDLGIESFIVGVVGSLQLEVLEYRLLNEYSAQLLMNQLGYSVARWVYAENEKDIENLKGLDNGMLVYDKKDRPVILVNNEWALNWILDRNPGLQFLTVPSDVAKI